MATDLSSEGFTSVYDLPAEESGKFRSGDTALMLSGFHFLRQVQFGENSIALKSDAAEQRRGKIRKMAEQIERAARERRAAEQDDMYSGRGSMIIRLAGQKSAS